MTWCAVEVTVPPDIREQVGAWLVVATGQAIEERDDGVLVGFLEDEAGSVPLRLALEDTFGTGVEFAFRPIEPVDWSIRWRDGLAARQIGRLTVTPSWIPRPSGAPNPTVVLDPEMAFGTGEHGSTRAALTLLERFLTPGSRVLDLGSGSGILAIAAIKLGARIATGIEVDEEANLVARRNAERNEVKDTVHFLDGDAGALAPLVAPAELVLSNILRTVNVTLLPAIHGALTADGIAIFSGMERPEAPLFRSALQEQRFTILEEVEDCGWWAVAARPA